VLGAAALIAALAVVACSSGSTPHSAPAPSRATSALPSPPPVTPVSWRGCGGGFQCGAVAVPEDYTRAASPLLSVAVSRRLAGKPAQRAGVLFVDFGGPAISGAATLREAAALLPGGLLDRFDLVSFDPRGSGQSRPLTCPRGADLVSAAVGAPVTAAAGQPLPVAAVYRRVYAACQSADPALLATITSTTQARDLDRLRTALGVTRIHYLGLSYGSVLGLAYADLFPSHLAAMVLDSPIDPTERIATLAEQQAAGAEQALQAYLRGKGSAVASSFAALSARLRRAPLPAPGHGDPTPVSLSDLELATLTFLQQPSLTPQYPSALTAALAGNGRALRVLASSQYEDVDGTPVIGAYWATLCGDISERPSPVTANTQARALAARYPRLGGVAYTFAGGACTVWPAATQPVGLPKNQPAVAIVGGMQDPIAPYAAAQGLARKLPGSAFITRVGVGHTALANAAGDTCLSNAETAFLTAPASAPSRVTCTDPAG
jgi:pimeloyl-ACP methyl ester carboxylesterase